MVLYEFFYYRLYCWMERLEGKNSITHLSAAILFSALQMQNVFLLLLIGLKFGLISYYESSSWGSWVAYLIGILICIANCVFISRGDRYKKILEKYSAENSSKLMGRWADGFMISSVVLMAVVAYL